MAGALRAGGMILGALPASGTEETLERYLDAGIVSLLVPSDLAADPERLRTLACKAREGARARGLPPVLFALGGARDLCGAPELPGFPHPLGLAASGDKALALKAGRLLAQRLRACGVDLIFAPRFDLASDPKRALGILELFGEDPERSAAMALAYARGLASGGVLPCGACFPGCGFLATEGRQGPPLVPFPFERLSSVESRPFARAVKARLPAILVGRVLVPALEPERVPAARSARVIEGRLRRDLGFTGLCIGAKLDDDPAGVARAAVLGALAGADMTVAAEPHAAITAAAALERALEAGELPAPRVAVALARRERLVAQREGLRAAERSRIVPGLEALSLRAALRAATVFRAAKARGKRAFAAKAKGAAGPRAREFPLSALPRLVLVALPPSHDPDTGAVPAVLEALSRELPAAQLVPIAADPGLAEGEALVRLAGEVGGPALALTYDAHRHPRQESLVHLLEESVAEVAVIAMRDPYDAAFFPRAAARAAVYGFAPAQMRAAVALVRGDIAGRGVCPVSVLGLEV